MTTPRNRLPHRRPVVTEKIDAFGKTLFVSAGLDPISGEVREVFFAGGKEGSAMDAIMADVGVVISVALQHGVPAEALARSIARIPLSPLRPQDLDGGPVATVPASPVGSTLDWIMEIGANPASDTSTNR
jgi:ribonucleoside-diphosphate reductase alpha chain